MTWEDFCRWTVAFACLFNIGIMVAIFERVGRSFLPTVWMRMLMLSNVLSLLVIAVGVHARLGSPITYRTPLLAVAALVQLVSLVGIHHWYGTPVGIAHSGRMMKGRRD